jgi:serine/threonine-protein kinase HipA
MSDLELHLQDRIVGRVHRHANREGERISFRYDEEWLAADDCFSVDPELFLDARTTSPARGGVFGAFADCAPDPVMLSRRFDRRGAARVHFASALTLLGLADRDRASYPEIAEILQREGSRPREDSEELFRRMVFNICIANVDDHLRNHGFLRTSGGWALSPAYDLNPVPSDVRPRILTTNVTLDDATGSLDAARESATYFGLSTTRSGALITEVREAVGTWEVVARSAGASSRECSRMRSAFLVP